ncbi:MAG: hypothetical protein ACE37F_03420 [Nannocystaceae bacterium]|nr:hypothetical protein [bacterium]
MRRLGLICGLLGVGCGPAVILPEESGTDTAAPTGGSTGSGTGTGVDDGPLPTGPAPSTTSPTSVGQESSSSGAFGSESSSGEQALCWTSTLAFEAPEESRLLVADQDGDGVDELWLTFFGGGGPGSATEVFRFTPEGVPEPAGFFPGFMTGLHDIDGDQVRDAVGFAFGGGPPRLTFIPSPPGLVEGKPIQTTLGFEDGFEAFVDVNDDGLADFIRNADGTTVTELLLGDGAGGFVANAAMDAPFEGDVTALPVVGGDVTVLAESAYFDPLGDCIEHPLVAVLAALELELLWTGISFDGWVANAPLAAFGDGDEGSVYSRVCSPTDNTVALQVDTFIGAEFYSELYPPGSFVAVGDFSGDGVIDMTAGTVDGTGVETRLGESGGSFEAAEFNEVSYGDPVANRVHVVDLDLDGRDDVFVGASGGDGVLHFYRLLLGPC